MVGLRLNEAKSELEPVRDIQFLGLRLHLDQGRASLPVSKAQEIMARACRISSLETLSYIQVSQLMGALNWASGLIPLCHLHLRPLHFHSLGSDKPVCTIAAFRPCSPCYPTRAVAGPIVSHIRNPYPAFPGGVHHFHGRLDSGLERPHGGFSNCGCMDPFLTRARHQYVLELKEVILALHHWVTILQGHHVFIATDNTTVLAYINKQGGTHSYLLLRLVVDLFLWLQTRDINSPSQTHSGLPRCDSRPIVSAEPAHHDRVESPPRSHESDIQTVGNSSSGHVCHSPQHASSPVCLQFRSLEHWR